MSVGQESTSACGRRVFVAVHWAIQCAAIATGGRTRATDAPPSEAVSDGFPQTE